ncbi:apolipoprotein N-acyltransferase [Campylobacter gastrosuis]|uniref:Apolipoprotein N-acyltransferase n=1 Tax=Campylobacter gastrosuis TaxID=2974576 RepID=A0ABT7HMK0_9BACT|nr:apolipoprotein N-acyltransferase [Campylobacter gastrosuis]MDL0087947.1 apolipoprotein N-acyltransferase [Campylobacter gastrosuis]
MKLRNLTLALSVLNVKNLNRYFSTKIIIKAFVSALMVSNFIYLSIFENIFLDFISPFITIFGIYLLIFQTRAGFFLSGFFVGILWFYWISFSFIYYDLAFLIPLVLLFIGVVYGLLFFLASIFSFVFLRAVALFLLSYIAPFGFNWLNLEATLVLGAFSPNTTGLILIFLSAYLLNLRKFYKFLAILPLIFALQTDTKEPNFIPFNLELTNTNVPQHSKWDKAQKDAIIDENLRLINEAISQKKDAILLPESAFVTFLDHEKILQNELLKISEKIAIIGGGLAYENGQIYNSTYLFYEGKMSRFDKLVLVPFGEEIPLPEFIKPLINRLFFGGASDFKTAKNVSEYEIFNTKITNAICYEATSDKIYANHPKIVFAITNNGWFKTQNLSSTEPVLQRLLLKYYATKYGTTIYHAVNGSKSEIITPKLGLKAYGEIFGRD